MTRYVKTTLGAVANDPHTDEAPARVRIVLNAEHGGTGPDDKDAWDGTVSGAVEYDESGNQVLQVDSDRGNAGVRVSDQQYDVYEIRP